MDYLFILLGGPRAGAGGGQGWGAKGLEVSKEGHSFLYQKCILTVLMIQLTGNSA
jgi:hypothetical protein